MRPGLNMHEMWSRELVCGGQSPQEQRGGLSSEPGQGCAREVTEMLAHAYRKHSLSSFHKNWR